MDLGAWLNGLGLGAHAEAFAEHRIDAETLGLLTNEDLRELGVAAIGDRKKLLAAIADLDGAVAEAPAPPAAAREPAGERRQVTILFADLAGFTRLSRELGAEATHAILNRYFEAADGIVETYGGSIDKHMGDNVMAVFGAPVAHDDDPLRAVRAALDIQQTMTGLSQAVGHSLRAHIGIASGQVVASGTGSEAHREYTVTGDSVNLASRLQETADAGDTLISNAVWRAVADRVAAESLGAVAVKGLDEPVGMWRVTGLRDDASVGARGPFVGRRAELGQFTAAIEACRETGNGQVVFVRGEAGIGKTRLLEEFTAIATARGFACFRGLVLDFGAGKGRDAIRALVRGALGIPPGGGKAVRQAAADKAVAEALFEPDQRVILNDLLDLPQPTALRAMYDAMDNDTRNHRKRDVVAQMIKGLSARQPILVAIEDVHWADAITLAHLATMTATVRDCPALLVMTSRIEGDPLDQAWRGTTRGSPLTTVDLGPLRQEEATALAGAFIDTTDRFARDCIARAEGNPLFLEQLLRNAEERDETDLPASIQSLVLARMDRLPAADKRALQAASVIGQRFSLAALRHLLNDPTYVCAPLIAHYLVRPEAEDYLFAHALIQEGVYASLLKSRARELHRRAAAWFAERDPVLHAEHLDRAEDPAAPQAYLAAAEIQASEYRHERALALTDRGLELARGGADEFALTCTRGRLLNDLGVVAASIDAHRMALDIADNDVQRCRAWIGLAAAMRLSSDYREALAVLERAEPVADRHGLTLESARLYHLRGNLYFPLGDVERCREAHEKALRFARQAGSVEAEARALGGMGDAEYARGRMRTAHDYFSRCVALSRDQGLGRIEVANRPMAGLARVYLNELQAGLEDMLAAIEAAVRVGHRRAELNALNCTLFALFDLQRLDLAREHVARAEHLVRHLGARAWEPLNHFFKGQILHAEGRDHEALDEMQRALAVARETTVGFFAPRILAQIALITDHSAVRRNALDEGDAMLRAGSLGHNYLWFYRNAAEASLNAGDWDGADRYAAALEDYTRPEPLPWSDFFIACGRALAAFGRGQCDEATTRELRRLRGEAEAVGFGLALPALDEALAVE